MDHARINHINTARYKVTGSICYLWDKVRGSMYYHIMIYHRHLNLINETTRWKRNSPLEKNRHQWNVVRYVSTSAGQIHLLNKNIYPKTLGLIHRLIHSNSRYLNWPENWSSLWRSLDGSLSESSLINNNKSKYLCNILYNQWSDM